MTVYSRFGFWCILHPASDDSTLRYFGGNSRDERQISETLKWPIFATYPNSAMTSLCGNTKTKRLTPSGEATHNTINISYLYNFQNLFKLILFHIYTIVDSSAVWSVGSHYHGAKGLLLLLYRNKRIVCLLSEVVQLACSVSWLQYME